MIDLVTSTEIDAPAETVWKNLVDLERFSEWNPFIRDARGKPRIGAKLRLRVRSSLRLPLVFRPKVVACQENRELRWRGRFLSSWLGAGDHSFSIEPTAAGRVRFIQREVFTGVLPALLHELVVREARAGFMAMNEALKQRAESTACAASAKPAGSPPGQNASA